MPHQTTVIECNPNCGACCIAPSITSPIPGMPNGKAAGERCVQLDDHQRCKIFGKPERPQVCSDFKPCPTICGKTANEAMHILIELESLTA